MAAGVIHMGAVGALQPFGAVGSQALGHQQQQQQRVLQVVARLPGLGAVSVCVEAGTRVQDLIMSIETQVWGAYGVPVEVRKLSDLHNIDLAPSYEVGKLLDDEDDHPIVQAHFRRLDTHLLPSPSASASPSVRAATAPKDATSSSSSSSSSPRTKHRAVASSSPIPIPASSSSSSSSTSSSSSPSSLSPRPRLAQLAFVEPPPTKVLQNKEFCFTVAFAFPTGTISSSVHPPPSSDDRTKLSDDVVWCWVR
jgi:hypothetical protein